MTQDKQSAHASDIQGSVLETPAPAFSLVQGEQLARDIFGIEASASPLVSERDQNFRLRADDGRQYVLKISNPAESRAVLAFQQGALAHAAACDPDIPLPRICPTLQGKLLHTHAVGDTRYLVRAVTFLEGEPLSARGNGNNSPALRRNLGSCLARLGRALQGYFHPAARHELLWDMNRLPLLRPHVRHVGDRENRERVSRLLDRFEDQTYRQLPALRAQVIHNDLNPANVIIDPRDPDQVRGVIDFGDMVYAPLAVDVAVGIAYQLFDVPDPLSAACDLLGAYHVTNPLREQELDLLLELIIGRILMSATISEWRAREHPENAEYILGDMDATWNALKALEAVDAGQARARFRQACGFAAQSPAGPRDDSLRERRRDALGPTLKLFYERPLHLVRGEGPWLFDALGERYLDVYNNVAHVGHAHPEVAAAIASQSRSLNTNTRYLHGNIVELAEQLAESLPGELSVCMFVCTGSEANDLALQIARACSGHQGAIVSSFAYHGNTTAVFQLSPEDCPPEMRESWLETVPAPDLYGGPHRDSDPRAVEHYLAEVDQAIAQLGQRGHGTAAVFFDSIFSSEGIFLPPPGYLAGVYARVRAAGGLCVADEVQSGFGRSGRHMWGFESGAVVPDIVTLGKPMGNGHPIAAVITTPQIAERFALQRGYFNTFGGNPVSCAAGLAVLRVMQREQLQARAEDTGIYLRSGLEQLASRHALIGQVRGAGLFNAVELVSDRSSREPAVDQAKTAVNAMREHGVLIGRTGRRGNVLKLRPPLVFGRTHADLLIERLDRVLGEL